MTMRPRDNLNQALALLERGDFASGWPLYEARINHPDWSVWAVRDSIARHRNRLLRPGDSLAGRDILVITEQGLGDNIMFARYVPLLAERGARVTLACSPALRPIFERVDGIYALLSLPSNLPIRKLNLSALRFDGFAPLLSPPYLFGTTQETIPVEVPYLHVETARVGAWRKRYAVAGRSGCLRVGLVAQANPESPPAVEPVPPIEPRICPHCQGRLVFIRMLTPQQAMAPRRRGTRHTTVQSCWCASRRATGDRCYQCNSRPLA
jgi:hypothetical protein